MASPSSHDILPVNEALDDNESLVSSIVESSIVDTSSEADEDILQDCDDDSEKYTNISELPIYNKMLNSNSLQKQLEQITPLATYNNVSVSNSTNVVFGNVIKVKGVLNINVYKEKNNDNQENIEPLHKSRESSQVINKSSNDYISSTICRIIPRSCWFALKPSDKYKYVKEPVDIVVICHSATDSSISSTRNMEILRNIQTFHIDSQGWDDIGYNFLIGCDGNVYEGRGWGVVGVHTFGYNSRSIGICFIGSFSSSLPTEKALEACKNLLKRGTDEGHLTQNYKLLGHRQCISTVSPGRFLYEEISKWENFYNKGIDDNLMS